MKFFLNLAVLLVSLQLISQEEVINPSGQYYFTQSLTEDNSKTKFSKGPIDISIKKNHIVQVIDIENGEVTFKYLKFEADTLTLSDNFKKYNNSDSLTGDYKEFSMSVQNFKFYTKPYLRRFTDFKVGSYTVPVRLRSTNDNFEFESNLSVGLNIIRGIRFNRRNDNLRVDFSLGIALTKVNLNKNNSDLQNIDSTLETLSQSALTYSFGTLLHLTDTVNLGLFYGWDFLDGAEQKKLKWVHNKKPWIGLGINVAFNSKSANNDGSNPNQ